MSGPKRKLLEFSRSYQQYCYGTGEVIKDDVREDSFRACVASLLGASTDSIPHFFYCEMNEREARESMVLFEKWLYSQYRLTYIEIPFKMESLTESVEVLDEIFKTIHASDSACIVTGMNTRGTGIKSCIYNGSILVHDPGFAPGQEEGLGGPVYYESTGEILYWIGMLAVTRKIETSENGGELRKH